MISWRFLRTTAVCAAALMLAACAGVRPAEYLSTTVGPPRPFSPAARVNGILYLSGQIGTDSSGTIVPGGIQAETRQVMENIGAVLRRSGTSFDRVVKCTVFITDMK